MGQIQNAVLGMIGTMGVASYALQRTPQFQERRQKQETIRQHKEALKEGEDTIRGRKAQRFETALVGYNKFLDEIEPFLSGDERYKSESDALLKNSSCIQTIVVSAISSGTPIFFEL